MPDLRPNRFVEIAVVLAVCAFLFFYGLGSFGLLGADEPRYAQTGAEMLARHDWIVPTLNGTPWLEKPPLLYWGEMASYAVFGVHDWAARVPVALMTSLMVLAIYLFVRRRLPGWALNAALITASLAAVVGFGRGASTDMPLTVCFTVAMLAWLEWFSDGARAWLLVFYAFSALGMLAKGPVAPFLAVVLIVAFAAVRREGKLILRTLWWPGILLFLAISLPWYVAVQLKTGDFFRVFILEHNLARFGTGLYRHQQPFWYYVPVVLALMMPWTAIFIAELVRLARRFRVLRAEPASMPLTLFVTLWFVIPVIFFSISQSKLPGYVLPSIPAAALLVVAYLYDREEPRIPLGIALLHAACCGALFAGILLAPHFLLRVHPPAAAIATAAVAGALIFAIVAFAIIRRGVRLAHAVTLIPVLLAVAFIVKVAVSSLDATQSARPVAEEIRRLAYPDNSPVLAFQLKRETEYGLPFYRHAQAIHYEGGALPVKSAMIVARRGSRAELEQALPLGTVLAHVADFEPQRLEFYMASPGAKHQ